MAFAGFSASPSSLMQPPRSIGLAFQYAPRVYLHPREPWGPLRPDDFIGASRLVWNSPRIDDELAGRGSIESERLGADCETAAEGCYEHSGCAADQVTRPTESPAIRAPGLSPRRGFAIDPDGTVKRPSAPGNPNIPVYWEVRGSSDSFRITYWFFYGFNGRTLDMHEGDWVVYDVLGASLQVNQAIVPFLTVKRGEVFMPDWGPRPWGWEPDRVLPAVAGVGGCC